MISLGRGRSGRPFWQEWSLQSGPGIVRAPKIFSELFNMLSASPVRFSGSPGPMPTRFISCLTGGLSLESASAADDDEGGHVDLLPQRFALQKPGGIGPEELFSIAANVFCYENIPLATDIQSAYELPVAPLAAGIVKGDRHLQTLPPAASGPRSPATE